MSLETMQGSDGYTHREVIGGPVNIDAPYLPSIREEARHLVKGEKANAYGPMRESFTRIGRLWGAYLGIPDIPPEKVSQMMVLFKVSRTAYKFHRNDLVDQDGYGQCTVELWQGD